MIGRWWMEGKAREEVCKNCFHTRDEHHLCDGCDHGRESHIPCELGYCNCLEFEYDETDTNPLMHCYLYDIWYTNRLHHAREYHNKNFKMNVFGYSPKEEDFWYDAKNVSEKLDEWLQER